MRSNVLLTLFILCYMLPSFTPCCGIKVPYDVSRQTDLSNTDIHIIQEISREKRELESFDNEEYPSAVSQDEQEEPGFWDRIVKVAFKLFNRFIEWLNSS